MPRDCFDCLCCLSNVFVIFRCKLLLVVCCILTTTSVWVIRMNANSRGNNGVPNTTFNVTHFEMVEDSDKATPAIEMQSEVPIPKVEMNIPSKKSDVTEEICHRNGPCCLCCSFRKVIEPNSSHV